MLINDLLKKYLYPVAILSGTIIGVGFFSLPYITMKTGIWLMLFYFLVLGGLVIIVHFLFGELSLKTPDFKRLPGFARIHLGRWGQVVAFISVLLGLFGALLAYLIVGGEFLAALLSPILGGDVLFYVLFYFLTGSVVIYFGIKPVAKIELWGLILFFIVLIAIFIKGLPYISLSNIFIENWSLKIENWFLPYGAILFSLWGATLIPEVEEMLGRQKKLLRTIIPVSILIPVFVYLFFIVVILGLTGSQTTESALIGLKGVLGNGLVGLGLFFGVVTTFTSFISLGLTLLKTLWYDLKIEKKSAWVMACFTPLILYLLGLKSFILVISFVGGVLLSIDGVLILLMYKKIGGKNIIIYPLILIFVLGIIYQITYFLK